MKPHTEAYIKYLTETPKPSAKDGSKSSTNPYSPVYIHNISYYVDKLDEPITVEKINNFTKKLDINPPTVSGLGTFLTWYKFGKVTKELRAKATEGLFMPPKKQQRKSLSERILSTEEVNKLFNEAPNLESRLILELFYFTASRRGNSLNKSGLLWIQAEKIDFQNMMCHITAKGGKLFDLYWSDTKTNDDLKEYIKQNNIKKGIRVLCRNILNRDVTPHDFRRTALTHMALKGANVLEIMKKAGHSQPQTSMIYLDLGAEVAKKATEKYLSRDSKEVK